MMATGRRGAHFITMRKLRPLTGQVLVELLPSEAASAGGIALPNRTLSPEEVQERHANPEKPPGLIGIVRAVGKWPKLKCGMLMMPEFSTGMRVVIPARCGTELSWDHSRRLKLVDQSEILAVVTESV